MAADVVVEQVGVDLALAGIEVDRVDSEVIPDAVVAVLPRLGHLAPEDHPEKIASAILSHC